MDLHPSSKETRKKGSQSRDSNMTSARILVLKEVGLPFRLKGDPKQSHLEIDNAELFTDYTREQWMGTIVKKNMFLFDRYIMPEFAFQVIEIDPDNSVITRQTEIRLAPSSEETKLQHTISLDDIIGHEKVKNKCRLILKHLKNPISLGEWAPRAVLFHGPPGTGKTLTARAVASEADSKIFVTKASDLIGTHVGDGGRRINTLFEDARKLAPSIIFIDELDAIGLSRSFQSIRGDVSEVVTALLGELDQIAEDSGIVVIAVTNARSLLDAALQSRFDAVFEFKLPTERERFQILEMYAARLPLPIELDFSMIAAKTSGLSGRDIKNRLLKESLHIALAQDMSLISSEIVLSVLKQIKTKTSVDYAI